MLSLRGSKGATGGLIAVGMLVHIVLGLLSTLIVFMWAFTLHAFWGWNPHLLLFTPLSLIVASLLPMTRTRPRLRWWIERYHFTMAASAFIVAVATLVSPRGAPGIGPEMLVTWASALWLFHLAFGLALYRTAPGGPSTPGPTTAGMRMAA